jgi:hypothetical protein
MTAAHRHSLVHVDAAKRISFKRPPGVAWRDYLIMLLHLAAEVEHGLMVQYLYAAYSLGGPQVTPKRAEKVARWQRSILDVAKEEMGHLLTVQNILALLGAPPNFNRGETPFDMALSPIPFVLAPLTREVVASFTYAEMSPGVHHPEHGKSIKHITRETLKLSRRLGRRHLAPEPVGVLYEEIINVLSSEKHIPDEDLHELSYETQASWDDWGRGYAPDPKRLTPTGDLVEGQHTHHRASVLVLRAATRTEALAALHAISSQGEAEHLKHPHRIRLNAKEAMIEDDTSDAAESGHTGHEEPSHFERFLDIWRHYPRAWSPHINLMWNPTTRPTTDPNHHHIRHGVVHDWGLLFNCRYRMLLSFLAHSYRLSRLMRPGEPGLRGMVMHRAFGEMYHIKTISGLMVQMKVSQPGEPDLFAGPPFETPYSIAMPAVDADCWRLHRDLMEGSLELNHKISAAGGTLGRTYLQSLAELDRQAMAWIDGILGVQHSRKRA